MLQNNLHGEGEEVKRKKTAFYLHELPNDMRDKIKMGTVSHFKEWINKACDMADKAISRWINCQLCSVCKQLR